METASSQQRNDPGKRFGLALFYFLVCAAIAGAATGLRLLLWNKGMDAGEALSWHIATQPGAAAVEAEARAYAQQPLYYLLAHHWLRVAGASLFNLRLFSALWGAAWLMLLYPFGCWLARARNGGWLAMLIAAASPYAAFVSLAAGPDAMLAALALLSCIPFLEFTRDRTPLWAWPAWTAATVFLLLVHPYAVAVPLFQAAYMLLARREKSVWFRRCWFGLLGVALVAYLALRGGMPHEAQRRVAFILPESMEKLQLLLALIGLGTVNGGPPTPVMTMENFTALTVFSALGVGAASLWVLKLRRTHPRRARVLWLFAAVPVPVLFFSCTSFHGVVLWNHFAFFSSAAWLMTAFVLLHGRNRTGRAALAGLVLIVNIAGFQAYARAPHLSYNWRGAFEHVLRHDHTPPGQPAVLLSMAPPDHRPLTDFYAHRTDSDMTVTAARLSPISGDFQTAPSVLAADAAYAHDCFWTLMKQDALEENLPHDWRTRFFTLRHARTFPSVFTQPALHAEQLCATDDTKSLRAMNRKHFVEYLLGVPAAPNALEEQYARANFFFERGYLDLAERQMMAVKQEYGDLRGIDLNLCFIALGKGKETRDTERLEQALALCRAAHEDEPDNVPIHGLLGEILFHLGRYEECRAPLQRVLDSKETCDHNPNMCMRASYFSGAALYRLGRKEQALPLLDQAIPSRDIGPRASYLAGVANYELGYPEDALPHLKRVIGVDVLGDQALQLIQRIRAEYPDLFKDEQSGRFISPNP